MSRSNKTAEVVLAYRGMASGPYRWFWDHYPALAEARKEGRRPDWIHIAATLSAAGIRAKGGRKLKADTVRRAWARVEADVAKYGYSGPLPADNEEPAAREAKPSGARAKPVVRSAPTAEPEQTTEPPAKPHWTDP